MFGDVTKKDGLERWGEIEAENLDYDLFCWAGCETENFILKSNIFGVDLRVWIAKKKISKTRMNNLGKGPFENDVIKFDFAPISLLNKNNLYLLNKSSQHANNLGTITTMNSLMNLLLTNSK